MCLTPPTRGRELKYIRHSAQIVVQLDAPHAGARIEIEPFLKPTLEYLGRPPRGGEN